MKTAKEIFIKHWNKATVLPCDDAVMSSMQYCLDAMEEYATQQVNLLNKPAVIGSLPSDVEDYIVKTSAYLDDDFKMKGNKEIEDKLKRHSERLIAKYAS